MLLRTPRAHQAPCAPIGFATVIALATMMAAAVTAWAAAGPPRFVNYQFPTGIGDDSGEPSIGSNWTREQSFMNSSGIPIPNGGSVNYFGGFQKYMTNVIFNDCSSPARVEWHAKSLLTASTTRVYGDPILFTDHQSGRTFVGQLEGLTPLGSTVDITDNDGDLFTPSEGSGLPSCIDHETIGGGPFHAPLISPPPPAYPNAVYYASQCGLSPGPATIALSEDGGYTYGPSVTMWTTQCAGLHGHIKVGPDGTVYVPVRGCSGNTGVAVSENNGTTWSIRTVASSPSGDRDPSCGAANDGNTVYLGWQGADGHPRVAVSHNKGMNWLNVTDVGASVGVIRCAFPAVVAGDANRAAFSFFGSTANGAYDSPSYPGIWYLYIATTFDGGVTWTTQNVTPNDPIQRGGICGVDNPDCRNLLDFYDMTIDKQGRILIGYDDGCIGGCVHNPPNSFTSQGAIARQSGGMRMFSTYDPVEPALAQAPNVTGYEFGTSVLLTWPQPDNNGATITTYKVYRQVNGGAFLLRATVNETQYLDTIDPADANVYRVTAVNSQGEGPYCSDIVPIDGPPPTSCTGIVAVTDIFPDGGNNDFEQNTPEDGTVNIRTLTMSEPYLGPGINQTWFKLQVEPSVTGLAPPNSQWYIVWNRRTIGPNSSDRRFLGMRTNTTGMPIFIYGDWGPPLPIGSPPPPHFNEPQILGWPDFASYDPAAGVIFMKLANSKLDQGGLVAGQSLVDLNVRTYLSRPDSGQRSQNNASDITANGNYTLAGNAACFVNTAPVARLSANPTSGEAPLTVAFDASTSSDLDAGDFVASYTITYGDGSQPVTQASPSFSHQYTTPSGTSGYFVTLTVKDSYGLQSTNTASANILVTERPTAVELTARAEAEPGRVKLTWQSSDRQIDAGTVYRRVAEEGWTTLGRISPDNAGMMTYVDNDVVQGATYGYRLGVIQGGGQEVYSSEQIVTVPRAQFALFIPQNPARGGMGFTLALDRDGPVSVTVFSPAGRRVANVVNSWMPAGKHTLRWGGQDLSGNRVSAGIYLLRATSGDRTRIARVSLLR